MKSNRSEEDGDGARPGTPEPVPYVAARGDLAQIIERSRARLGPLATSVIHLATTGSTNDVAATIATEGAVVIADEQTAGRGRRGHAWFSPSGSGLYVSVVLTPSRARIDVDRATLLLTLAAGVAIAEGIHAATGLGPALKWPNDLFIGRRKIAGILAESADRSVVLGYGINVTASAYPPELGDRATSLESELGRAVERHHVLVETLAALGARYDDLLSGRFDAILDAWRSRAASATGARVEWNSAGERQTGVTVGIDDRGALLVRSGDRIERIVSGELKWE